MTPADDLGRLDPGEWEQLQDVADRFEAAWQREDSTDLNDFLPPVGNPLRLAALHELIKIDLEFRQRRHRGVNLETYVQSFPELGSVPTISPRLIYEEYRVRALYGDKPLLAEYHARFQEQFVQVEKLIEAQTPRPAERPAPIPEPSRARPNDTLSDLVIQGGDGYHFIQRIGVGTFAEVYRGEAPGGIPVAIKRIFRPIDAEEAKRELQALELVKQLRHPFLLATQAYWVAESRLFIVMELADGNLRGLLDDHRRQGRNGLPVSELLGYMSQAAPAIDFLHSRNVLHRDIKPENILVLQGFAKISDFSLARGPVKEMEFSSGSGTPRYMAPEAWRRKGGPESDQYGLALCYAELRQGRFPFPGQALSEVIKDHLHNSPDLGDLAANERQVLHRALAKEPRQRFENCSAFVAALRNALIKDSVLPSTAL